MSLAIPLLMLFLAQSSSKKGRTPFKGKSGHTWFVFDSQAGASNTPVRDVFASANGNDLVLSFAVLPGGIRAQVFRSPSTLALPAIADFGVSDFKAGKL